MKSDICVAYPEERSHILLDSRSNILLKMFNAFSIFCIFYRKIKSGMTVKGFAEMATPLKRLAMTFFIIVILSLFLFTVITALEAGQRSEQAPFRVSRSIQY